MDLVIGLALAVIVPLLFLGIIRKLDFYQTGQFKLILLSLVGGVAAYVVASILNESLGYFELADRIRVILFYAPVLEEIFKGSILFMMIKRSQFTYSVDGALYGFACGIGFAIYENFEYIFKNLVDAAEIGAQRIVSANLVHASSSAIVGIALGMFFLRRTSLRWLVLGLGLSLAIGQHMVYNKISLEGGSLAAAIGMGFLGVLFVFLAMQLGKIQARRWIKQNLGMGERITQSEIAVVERLGSTKELLRPVYERFGAEKVTQVERLLYLQARLGIKRKALDVFEKDDPQYSALEAEIRKMRKEMETVRRSVGIYVMLFVRGLYTEEVASVWEQIQAKIRERSLKGGGLWSSLEERIKAPRDAERHK